jgi:uncharacterized spore protein YtfJ
MSDEETRETETPQTLAASATAAVERVGETFERFLGTAGAARVWGEPVAHGETTLLPAAEVVAAAGFGMGSGSGEDGQERGGGGGGGGGGHTFSRPVAVVVASPAGVRVEPVIDVTKIALAALTAAGFVLGGFLKLRRAERRLLEE